MTDISRRHVLALSTGLGLLGAVGVARATPTWAANNNEIAWDFFRGKGLSEAQTAGLIGNFIIESGSDPINPAAEQFGGGPGRGIAQWEGSRREDLYDYASSRGLAWSNLQLQLDFVWKEFTSTESYALSKLKATSTPADAAVAVRKYYERPSVHNDSGRINAAEKVYAELSGNAVPGETGFPLVKNGSRGTAVTVVQYLLTSHGYATTADGIFGSGTESKVKAFQTAKGLGVDGIVGDNTWMSVIKVVRNGDRGDAVKALQTALKAAGHGTTVDGIFGAGTEKAVRAVQTAADLPVDGVAAPEVWGNVVD